MLRFLVAENKKPNAQAPLMTIKKEQLMTLTNFLKVAILKKYKLRGDKENIELLVAEEGLEPPTPGL